MNEQIGPLEKDVSILRIDTSKLKADMSLLKEDVSTLKKDVADVKTDVAVILSNYSTKADLAQLELKLTRWCFGSVVTLAAVVVASVKFIR